MNVMRYDIGYYERNVEHESVAVMRESSEERGSIAVIGEGQELH